MIKKQGHAYQQAGFTLIELLVAMGIVAVLTAMSVFNFNQSRVRARDISRKSDLSQLQKAMEVYKNDNGKYPIKVGFQDILMDTQNNKANPYSKVEFNDPRGSEWVSYVYSPNASLTLYYLMACLENTADQTKSSSGLGTYCDEFNNKEEIDPSVCTCGPSDKGVMYIITQP